MQATQERSGDLVSEGAEIGIQYFVESSSDAREDWFSRLSDPLEVRLRRKCCRGYSRRGSKRPLSNHRGRPARRVRTEKTLFRRHHAEAAATGDRARGVGRRVMNLRPVRTVHREESYERWSHAPVQLQLRLCSRGMPVLMMTTCSYPQPSTVNIPFCRMVAVV